MQRKQIFRNALVQQYALSIGEGSLAGVIATIPMTLFMLAGQYLLPQWQHYALPPERLTGILAKQAGVKLDKPHLLVASVVSHFGFGGAMGAIYGPLMRSVSSFEQITETLCEPIVRIVVEGLGVRLILETD